MTLAAMSEDDLFRLAAIELLALEEPYLLAMPGRDLLLLAGMLQLACRHPDLPFPAGALATDLLESARSYFAACPTVREILRRGDDPDDPCDVLV
jgi:hypothetical protein